MGMAVTYYTADMVRALPDDGQRYEVGGDTLVQPDLFVVPLGEARTLDWSQMRTLLLAVEVLSPSTARADRFTKRRLYQEVGIPHLLDRGSGRANPRGLDTVRHVAGGGARDGHMASGRRRRATPDRDCGAVPAHLTTRTIEDERT